MKLFSEGPRDARIMIVGEAPGNQEIAQGRPFVGGSGDLLNRMLGRVGINRHECFVTNVCHTQPPGNDFAWFMRKENQGHLLNGILRLKQDIEEIKPNVVVALGSHPLKVLTGRTGIDKWRGSVLPSGLVKGVKVIGTYHPAYLLRVYDYKAVAEFDLAKVSRHKDDARILLPKRHIHLPDGRWVRDQVGQTEFTWQDGHWDLERDAAALERAGEYSVDIECYSTPAGWRLACVGFSCDPDWALVIPADSASNLAYIRRLCGGSARKVLQNGTFDFTVLAEEGIELTNFWWDTMIAHHILYAEAAGGGDEMAALSGTKRQAAIAKGLAFLTSINTDEPHYKEDGKLWKEDPDPINGRRIFFRYNGLDCCVTQESRMRQEEDLRDSGLYAAFRDRMELVNPLARGTNIGIRVDLARRKEMDERVEQEITNLQKLLDAMAGHSVNVSSNKQITAFLYDELKLPAVKNKQTGARTANEDALVTLAGKHSHPALHTILAIRERRVLRERYLDTPVDKDGRMRCSFDITGTRSYRLASRASIHGSGTNLQNQPEFIREVYVADPGKVFLYRDFSQAEARDVAYLARDQWLIDLFNDPTRDIHKETAAKIFGVDVSAVTPDQRQIGKKARHALNYGMFAGRFVEVVNKEAAVTGIRIDQRLAQKVIDGFFMLHPNHKTVYWRGIEDELRYSRTLTNAFGYKRTFYGRWDDNLLRDAYSWKPQSTVGILGAKAWVAIDRAVRPLGADVLLNVHDSLLVQCDDDTETIAEVAKRMEDAMAIPIEENGYTFTIPTDSKCGWNWGYRSKDGSKNPNGLVDLEKHFELGRHRV